MRALKTVGDVLPLADLLSWSRPTARPAFAVTFDDDDPGYVVHLLPILTELGIPATFFLSGRSLHGLGPYWWRLVDRSIAEIGLDRTAALLGHTARTVEELATACKCAATVDALAPRLSPPVMQADDIRTLARADMTIGFHTLHHPVLPFLNDEELDRALIEGREALAAVAAAPVDLLAYPYGRADARVARAAERAGYTAALTADWRSVSRDSDLFLMSRWQPGPLAARDFLAQAALRINLAPAYAA
jgi:peptidoglycan/xylan/chitin deacetylase (PgdA/CDA1 family)